MNHGVQYYHVMSSVTSKFIAAKFIDKFFDLLVLFDRINHSFLLGRLSSCGALTFLVYLHSFSVSFAVFFFFPQRHNISAQDVLLSSLAILLILQAII